MSYNKKAHLRANIDAIKLIFDIDREKRLSTESERNTLLKYSGFGGLKAVLNPANSLADIGNWAKSELDLFPLVAELHEALRVNTNSEQEYKQYINSIKNSVLSAFYTPTPIVQTIADAFLDSNIAVNKILDPSAGMGEFSSAYSSRYLNTQITNYEKDLLTGKILSHINPNDKVIIDGFETIDRRYNNHFDIVTSNIPFGEVRVFDAEFMKTDKLHRDATRYIHNYFFVKGIDTLREGGVLAFITSQGVLDSPTNQPIRKWLMDNTNLVSAIRLPNNLFVENAGTEVGSDLIVLQKNSQKNSLTKQERDFLATDTLSSGIIINSSFQRMNRIVHTKGYPDTDPYGKPAQIFIHDGGTDGIANDLKAMLVQDLSINLNRELYNKHLLQNTSSPSSGSTPPPKSEEKNETIELNVSQPTMSLYDLFGFTEEERSQIKPQRRKSNKATTTKPPAQLSLFSTENQNKTESKKTVESPKEPIFPKEFEGELTEHIKLGSLVKEGQQIGVITERYRDSAIYKPLDLHFGEKNKISAYINLRDSYHKLYNDEATNLIENPFFRNELNLAYDTFQKRYGNLNDKSNIGILKMDAGSTEILSLERSVEGKLQKADIFQKPVAFNPNEIKHAETSHEALVASLNKYGEINLGYMITLLDNKAQEEVIKDLEGQIYFNPLIQNYEIRDKFIAGNVIEKAAQVEDYLNKHPADIRSQVSLKALQDSIPQPIRYEELDFNFGERWIPMPIYRDYASQLFESNIKIDYYASRDDFHVTTDRENLIIREKFAVQSESQLFTGIHLMKNALLNTTPNITKTVQVLDENGEQKKVKVADSEAIQLANSKIDEIRNGFTDWLNDQSTDFKNDLADLYNKKFNCYVRPEYDGSHQTFPDLNLKGLGIPDLYPSQKDCIWMQKLMGGGIADHEVLRP